MSMYYSTCNVTTLLLPWNLGTQVKSHSRVLLYPLGTDYAQKTQPLYCCAAQITQ
jgi:hypothetical protein